MSLRYGVVRKEGDKNAVERVRITRHFAGKDTFATNDSSDDEIIKKPIQKEIEKPKMISTIQHDSQEEDSDEETQRRERLRKRMLQRQQEEEMEAEPQVKEEEYDADNQVDDESEPDSPLELEEEKEEILKPLFVPKTHRSTIFELQKQQKEEDRIREEQEKKKIERVMETKELIKAKRFVVEEDTEELPDDEDDEDDDNEYELWKQREIRRVKRERDVKFAREMEKAEIERRRNMTDLERKAEDEELERLHGKKEKKNWKFLQRYMHGGAFYQDEKEKDSEFGKVLKRDYASAPTGDDAMDKEILPSVMQVRRWGQKGRTKYTHLTAEDTTFVDKEAPIVQEDVKRKLARDIVVQQQNALKKRKL